MIKRELYMSKIRPFINLEPIKVLTGFRRSGKSVMLELIKEELLERGCRKEQFLSFNFERLDLQPLCNANSLHTEILNRAERIDGKVYLFFDEIQEVKDWEKCVNSLRVDIDCDIYITGSNAKLLSGELATYLAGRYVEFVIYPFSFDEFQNLYHTTYPNTSTPCSLYLEDLYSSVVLKDIVKRNEIRDVDLLEKIIAYVMSNIGTTFSATSVSKYFKSEGRTVGAETILNYIRYAVSAYLVYQVKREDVQGKQILSSNEKYYIADQGIREAVFGTNAKDINLVLQNIVYMELLRRGYQVTVGKVGTKEIDFIAKKQNDKVYVQVTYLLATEDTIEREFSVLEQVRDNYPKYVVSMDELDFSRNGIKHRNIKDFLSTKHDYIS